jgi:hypothetical protein
MDARRAGFIRSGGRFAARISAPRWRDMVLSFGPLDLQGLGQMFYRLLVAAPLALAAPAYALTPPTGVEGWTAVQYHDYLLQRHDAVSVAMNEYLSAVGTRHPPTILDYRVKVAQAVEDSLTLVSALAPYQDDASLRDASLRSFELYRGLIASEFMQVEALVADGITDAEGEQIGQLLGATKGKIEQDSQALGATEQAFAARWGFALPAESKPPSSNLTPTPSSPTPSGPTASAPTPEPSPIRFDLNLSVDRTPSQDRGGFSFGYGIHYPTFASGLTWRRSGKDELRRDRIEWVGSMKLIGFGPSYFRVRIRPVVGFGHAWGRGDNGWGLYLGSQLGFHFKNGLYAFSRAGGAWYGAQVRDELGGLDLQFGAGITY